MYVSLIQRSLHWADPESNRKMMRNAIMFDYIPDVDLYVFPEMWTTGFVTDPQGIAESDGASLRFMQQLADETDAAIAGSIAVEENGKYYNRFYFVKPHEAPEHYDKRHLFTYGSEHLHYTPGDRRVVVEWRGVRFLLQVCYDLRFPVFSRNHEDYDAIIYVASWPQSRRAAWDILLKARAIENQCYVLAVNRTGDDPKCEYLGGTIAIDPYGTTLVSSPDDASSRLTFPINLDTLAAFRAKFPVLKDRD